MFQHKSVRELKAILLSLTSRFEKIDQDAVRDKTRDYKLLPQSKLNYILKSEIPALEKKLLLSQIGLLRINLFAEYSERMQIFEENNQLDKAVEVMNEYAANIAIPFIPS